MVSPLTHWAAVLGTYARGGEDSLDDVADRIEAAAHDRPGGKFGKAEALYLPQAPFPPTLWRTSCGRCRFYEEGAPGEPGQCHVVGREGDRAGGEAIHYRGWCTYWMPPAGEPALAWLRQRLAPDGRTEVRGEYDPTPTAREAHQSEPGWVRTEPEARKDADDGEPAEASPDGG